MSGNGQGTAAAPAKTLFRIGEVCRLTDTKAFVLRYWETEFPMLQPVKTPKGHRLYRREDIETVLRIKRLLYDEGFTIAGARRHLREEAGGAPSPEAGAPEEADSPKPARAAAKDVESTINRKVLLDLRDALHRFLTLLETE